MSFYSFFIVALHMITCQAPSRGSWIREGLEKPRAKTEGVLEPLFTPAAKIPAANIFSPPKFQLITFTHSFPATERNSLPFLWSSRLYVS